MVQAEPFGRGDAIQGAAAILHVKISKRRLQVQVAGS